jgi:hypothetical protein
MQSVVGESELRIHANCHDFNIQLQYSPNTHLSKGTLLFKIASKAPLAITSGNLGFVFLDAFTAPSTTCSSLVGTSTDSTVVLKRVASRT